MSEPSSYRSRRPRAASSWLFLSALSVWLPAQVAAQTDTMVPVAVQEAAPIRWWHGAIVLGGLSALTLLDQPTEHYLQERRSSSLDRWSKRVRHFGQPEVYGTVTVGLVAAGLLSHNDDLTRAGGRLAATLLLAGATAGAGKLVLGRSRPSDTPDADVFHPFSRADAAMPSGHSSVAFALAAALSDDIHRTWATIGLYTLASGVAWSRMNDNKHWLSDVAAGAAVGITSAKLVNGRWRLFHLRPPKVLLGPHYAGLAWQAAF